MIRLTPEQALRAYLENRDVYRLELLDPHETWISEILDSSDNLVSFEETARENPENLRDRATAAEETEPEAVAKNQETPKKNYLNRAEIYKQYLEGRKPEDIATQYGVTEAAILYHIWRAREAEQA